MSVTLWIETKCNSFIANDVEGVCHFKSNAAHEAAYTEQSDTARKPSEDSKE